MNIRWARVAALLACLAYVHAFGNPFLHDDVRIIRDDPRVRELSRLPECFTTGYWGELVDRGLYRPLVLASFNLNHAVCGLDTRGWTAVNLALHAGVTALVVRLALSLGAAPVVAGAAGLLFAVHPVHVEAVAGFVGRAELMAALFFLLALLAHRRALGPSHPMARRAFAAGCWLAALLSKESAVTLALVLPALDLLAPRPRPRLLHDYPWFAAAALLWVGLRVAVLGRFVGGDAPVQFVINPLAAGPPGAPTVLGHVYGVTPVQAWLTPLAVLAEYARLLVWPWRLSADYSYDQIPLAGAVTDLRVLAGGAALAAVVLGAGFLRRRLPVAACGLALLGLSFAATCGLLFPIGTICAERLLYLPSAGLCLAVAAAGGSLARRGDRWRWAMLCALGLVCFLFVGQTRVGSRAWGSAWTLWESSVRATPRSCRVHDFLGDLLATAARKELDRMGGGGDAREAQRLLNHAAGHMEAALAIYPELPEATANLAAIRAQQGRYDEAEELFRRVALLQPDWPGPWKDRGVAFMRRALEGRERDPRADLWAKEAEKYLGEAIARDPAYVEAYYNRGVLYRDFLGDPARAAPDFREVLRLRPDHPQRVLLAEELERLQGGRGKK